MAKKTKCCVGAVLSLACWIGCGGDEENTVRIQSMFELADEVQLRSVEGDPVGSATDVVAWNGRIAVADGLAKNVKVFDPDGTLSTTLGRVGDGPGEFRFPTALAVDAEGRLAVLDDGHGRVSFFDRDGTLAGEFQFHGIMGWSMAALEGGTQLAIAARIVDPETRELQSETLGHVFDTDGREQYGFGQWPRAGSRAETAFGGLWMTVVDSIAMWSLVGRHAVFSTRLFEPRGVRETVDTVMVEGLAAPDWSAAPENEEDLRDWVFRHEIVADVVGGEGRAVIRFQVGDPRRGEERYRYALIGTEPPRVAAVSRLTSKLIQRGSGDRWLGVEIDGVGDAYLRSYVLSRAAVESISADVEGR